MNDDGRLKREDYFWVAAAAFGVPVTMFLIGLFVWLASYTNASLVSPPVTSAAASTFAAVPVFMATVAILRAALLGR